MKHSVIDILLAPWITGVLSTSIRLNVFSVLSNQELTANEIAEKCMTIPQYQKILLDSCVCIGLLEFENNKYRNSHFSQIYFVEGEHFYIGDFLKLVNDESLQWFQLPDIIRGKEQAAKDQPYIRSDYQTFIKAMNCLGALGEATALKEIVNLSGLKKMVDVGGGSGLYSVALCQKYPELQSTIFDVKETLDVTQDMLANRPERNRIDFREGDFLKDSIGEKLDIVLLSDIIYEEAKSKFVLRNAWESLAQGGVLIIRGYYADPVDSGPLFGALFAVKHLVDNAQNKIVTKSSLEEMILDIGFTISIIKPLTEHSFVFVCNK